MRLASEDRGQALVVAALLMTILLGFAGLAVDVSWYELNLVRMQRAADAAALAGVVYLPRDPTGAINAALAEATKNGYANGTGGVSVVAQQDLINTGMLTVTVQASVQTYFARVFGTAAIQGSRTAAAEFILPVAMGSPQDYYGIANLCRNSDVPTACPEVPSATGIGTLTSQGFWGSVLTKGANRANGDAYSTYYNPAPTLNTGFDPNGYSYIVDLPAGTSAGSVWIFDPIFCATGRKTTAPFQRLGMGDVWYYIGATRTVTTEFKLWSTNGTPYSTADDVLIASDGGLFTNMDYVDKGPDYSGDNNYIFGYNGSSSTDCSTSPYHNAWWRLASGLGPGQYRLQVVTSSGSTGQQAANNFGIQVMATGGGARVYGQTRMCVYVNIPSSTALVYLAQVGAVHAGKTLEIRLFDPGDITNTTMRIKQPTASGYVDASFTFTATGSAGGAPTSGGPQTSLPTSNGLINFYDNQWVTISVALPVSYSAPTPPGETQPGWWKVEYTVGTSGQDVTTWEVQIRGNPVHLVVP
jgi:Flp pilus assembly protein TadG